MKNSKVGVSRGYQVFTVTNTVFLILLSFIMLFPLYKVFATSITTVGEYYSNPMVLWPSRPTWESYKYLMSTNEAMHSLLITVLTTLIGTGLSMAVTLMLAYSLSKRFVPGSFLVHRLLLVTMFLDSGTIPFYLMVRNLGLTNTIWSSILPAMVSLWNYLVIRSFFLGIPQSLEEAAVIDGASWMQVFLRIVLPTSMPVIATFTLFYAVSYWNTWYYCMLFNTNKSLQTLQLMLYRIIVANESNWGMQESYALQSGSRTINTEGIKMACCVIATVPILLVYPFLQKHFVKGVMLGAMKG